MNILIIGCGWIAEKMALTLADSPRGCRVYAVASRSVEKARAFAEKWHIPVAYGSYEEAVLDKEVDLVYIATPHSHHYRHAMLALEAGKPCLVEKAFTSNAADAEALIGFAHGRGLFVTEAIWTRYMPLSHRISEIISRGVIGDPKLLYASLSYPMADKPRIIRPELAGGALLDLGVYCINFARMYFGGEILRSVSNCFKASTGVDLQETISLSYADGRMANLQSGAFSQNDRMGIISGSEGFVRVDNINCPKLVEVFRDDKLVESYAAPDDMITGYEYQVFECARCMSEGLLESPLMPHAETLAIMHQMTDLLVEWGCPVV